MPAVAAPTASLHFDTALLAALAAGGIGQVRLTLHVGAGTFLPVKVENVDEHRMHAEWGEIGPDAVDPLTPSRRLCHAITISGTTRLTRTRLARTVRPTIATSAIIFSAHRSCRVDDEVHLRIRPNFGNIRAYSRSGTHKGDDGDHQPTPYPPPVAPA